MKLVVRLSFAILLQFAASGFAACSENDLVGAGIANGNVGNDGADGGADNGDNDGNDMETVVRALTMEHEGSPLMIIAHTVKGKGISEMENIASWHHGVPDEDLYLRARAVLASQRRKDG